MRSVSEESVRRTATGYCGLASLGIADAVDCAHTAPAGTLNASAATHHERTFFTKHLATSQRVQYYLLSGRMNAAKSRLRRVARAGHASPIRIYAQEDRID